MSDARAARHELKEFFGGPVQTWASAFSATASLVSPTTGQHLRVYSVELMAPGSNANEIEATVQDGATVRAHLYIPAGGIRKLRFDGRYLKVDTSLRVVHQGTVEQLAVNVHYRAADNV